MTHYRTKDENFQWNNELKAEAIGYYELGFTYQVISEKFTTRYGQFLSRSAIAGMLRRAGVVGARQPPKELSMPKKYKKSRNHPVTKYLTTSETVQAAIIAAPSRSIGIMQLNKHTCRWPLGEPRKSDFHYCGKRIMDRSPYCVEHTTKAWAQPGHVRHKSTKTGRFQMLSGGARNILTPSTRTLPLNWDQ